MAPPRQPRTSQASGPQYFAEVYFVPYILTKKKTESTVVYFVMDNVAGARQTPGRHKTGGVAPKPPATILLSAALLCSGTSVRPTRGVAASFLTRCRGGDFGFVSRHKPAERRIPDVSATPDVEASGITPCRGRRVTLLGELARGKADLRRSGTSVGVAAPFVLIVAAAAIRLELYVATVDSAHQQPPLGNGVLDVTGFCAHPHHRPV